MIDFTRAFDTAWERMHVILFRPFDFGKWCAIGFCAFLAGLLQGGNGINTTPNGNAFNGPPFNNSTTTTTTPQVDLHDLNAKIAHAMAGTQMAAVIGFAVLIFAVILVVVLLMYWLGARGEFMFLDNVVRNRGAIALPWTFYSRQGNSLFLFFLLIFAVTLAVLIIIAGGAALIGIPLLIHHEWPNGWQTAVLSLLAVFYVVFAIVIGVITFVFREMGIPLMFCQGLMARQAFIESMRLIGRFPGSIAIFILLRIAMFIGVVIICFIVCCATCCIGSLPYIGTVILLPVLVYVKCFTLDCLAQFGPQYDVFTVDVPPPAPGGNLPPFSPQRPPV